MSAIRAWKITDPSYDGSVIAFAESRSAAKSLAFRCDVLQETEWVDLKCTRLRDADSYIGDRGPTLVDGCADWHIELMWNLGWYPLEQSRNLCRECDRYEWEGFKPSELNYDDELDAVYEENGVCNDCQGPSNEPPAHTGAHSSLRAGLYTNNAP